MENVRTRFAPSPTGFMHIGNLRTCLYAYLWAKKHNGTFVLRIEDTDQERYVEGAVDVIYSTLKKAGIEHDEGPDKDGGYGPYIQSERKDLYLKYAKELVEKFVIVRHTFLGTNNPKYDLFREYLFTSKPLLTSTSKLPERATINSSVSL